MQKIKMRVITFGIRNFVKILLLTVVSQSQCPEYFRYFRNETTREIMGTVEIPAPPKNVPLHLHVILNVATVLPTKYVGRLELEKSKEESVRAVLQGLPLYYRIHFPVRNPLPLVTSITLNDAQYCIGPPAVGVVVTRIILEHSLYPPKVVVPLTEYLLDIISNGTDLPTIISNPDIPSVEHTTAKSDTKEISTKPKIIHYQLHNSSKNEPIDSTCGLTSGPNPLTMNGYPIMPIMWPWLAAVFEAQDGLKFQCAGNVISRQHVLTAANCLIADEGNILPNMLIVSLGRFKLSDWKENGSINAYVSEYKIHPDYKNTKSADSDLAILKLAERINYTPNIRPVCLWMSEIEFDKVIGRTGYIVGWGSSTEKSIEPSPEPHISEVSIVSEEQCQKCNIEVDEITSNRTFCAGNRNHDGEFNGDRGSGLIMLNPRNGRYHLRGIFSTSLLNIDTWSCNHNEYLVYIDIAKYLSWIKKECFHGKD